jgi:hypothetical protein
MEVGGGGGEGFPFAVAVLSGEGESEGFNSFTHPGKIINDKVAVRRYSFLITVV